MQSSGVLTDNGRLVLVSKTTYIGTRYFAYAGYDKHRQHTLVIQLYETSNPQTTKE